MITAKQDAEKPVALFDIGDMTGIKLGADRKASFAPGHNYAIELNGAASIRTNGSQGRAPANLLIFEFKILESDDPMLPPGSEAKWAVAPETDVGLKNLKLFFLAASGFKRGAAESPDALAQLKRAQGIIHYTVQQSSDILLGRTTFESRKNPDADMLGAAIKLQTKSMQTKPNFRGESFPYTAHTWAPYGEADATPF